MSIRYRTSKTFLVTTRDTSPLHLHLLLLLPTSPSHTCTSPHLTYLPTSTSPLSLFLTYLPLRDAHIATASKLFPHPTSLTSPHPTSSTPSANHPHTLPYNPYGPS
ncbi:hypothetical protein VTL71DRAFT_8154, partial [Oculimacula yallundae]